MDVRKFSALLRLEPEWGLGKPIYYYGKYWVALHFHTDEQVGWLSDMNDSDGSCSTCGSVFPDKVVGMLNMINGLV